MKAWLEIGAAALSLLGVIIGVWGTFLLTKWNHPYGFWDFHWSIWKMFVRKVAGRDDRSARVQATAAALSKLKDENKAESLHGLEWIFFGFVLQAIGAILLVVDACWVNFFLEKISQAPSVQ